MLTILSDASSSIEIALLAAQAGILVTQISYVYPFTRLHRVQSSAHDGSGTEENVVRVLSSNVKQSNRQFQKLIELIQERQPDIAVVLEVDQDWERALGTLRPTMPHCISWPKDNAYGMMLLSRLALIDPHLRFLVLEGVPSIRTGIRLRNGRVVRLYAVHPEPPVPYEDTVGRDGEMVLIAKEVSSDSLPCIVTGDLNDVAWSRSTKRFRKLSGLLDPRIGRGLFNTFDARIPFLRWPLDHLFHGPEFAVVSIARLPHIGSDHFPIEFALALEGKNGAGDQPRSADSDDIREAQDLAAEARTLDREPVGSQWENPREQK